MNKTKKRQLNLKNKLIAAIAMLLVSSIMMVSTTYAWFTLSTAPEVQGITTTVGANGNLEIALADPTGNNNLISSGVGDANESWLIKNLTWGNLLDLSDPAYSLNELTLLPSRLNITAATQTSPAILNGSPLAIPVYGADGRISALDGNKMNYGAKNPNSTTNGWMVDPSYPGYGVRALGTSSTQSETALNFQIALNAVNTYRGQANGKASGAIYTYGSALADMAVMHAALQGAADTNNYAAFVPQLKGMITELDEAAKLVEKALYNALVAMSNANIKSGETVFGEAEVPGTEQTVREYLKAGENLPLTTIWNNIPTMFVNVLNNNFPALVSAYNAWNANNTQITDTKNAIDALTGDNITWSQISPALSGLMNVDKVTLNGMSLDGLTPAKIMQNIANLNLELNDGSGVLANFGKLTGNLSATVALSDNAQYQGESLAGVSINLVTKSEPAGGPLLTQIRTTINAIGPAEGGDETNAIDVIYGYVLDFVFRTNAANSNLLLQTEGAQRIYGDSTNAATLGKGSSLTFASKYSDLESLVSMMSGIRVVFTNTVGDSTEVYGIAKAVFDNLEVSMKLNSASLFANPIVEENVTTYAQQIKENDEMVDLKAYLSTIETNGNVSLVLKTGAHQYVFVSEVEDGTTEGKDFLWTVKTAMWYTETTTQTVDGVDVTVTEEIELIDKNGNIMFYPEATIDTATGATVEMTDDELKAMLAAAVGGNANFAPTDLTGKDATETIEDAIVAGKAAGATMYFYIHDADNTAVEVEAPLYLHTYTVDNGVLNFGDPMAVQTLTGLDQNVITGVSAMVYLDGDYVDNTDVINSENGISNSGMLNLQFASSANLVPMENTALKQGETFDVTFDKAADIAVATAAEKASKGLDYTFALASNDYTVTYTVGDSGNEKTLEGAQMTYEGQTGWVYTIPAADVNGNITVKIVAAP